MTKDSPLTVAGAAAELGRFPAPHSLLIPKAGTVGNYGRSSSKFESIRLGRACDPHWTSALFLPHQHFCLSLACSLPALLYRGGQNCFRTIDECSVRNPDQRGCRAPADRRDRG